MNKRMILLRSSALLNTVPGKQLWLGETSSAYGGGAHGLSDRFVSCFNWLDKLGVAASNFYSVIVRQTFYHGSYALIDEALMPNPDYWVSLLYKQLVSHHHIHVQQKNSTGFFFIF